MIGAANRNESTRSSIPPWPGIRLPESLAEAARLKAEFGFRSHKLKAGIFHPDYELEAYRALATSLPGDSYRFDPNGVWSTEQAIRFGQAIEDLRI